jgi:hypothetical protein
MFCISSALINAGEKSADHHSASNALRRLLLTMKNTFIFLSIKSTKRDEWASQAVSRESAAALIPPGKSARLAYALDGNLVIKPAISGQK